MTMMHLRILSPCCCFLSAQLVDMIQHLYHILNCQMFSSSDTPVFHFCRICFSTHIVLKVIYTVFRTKMEDTKLIAVTPWNLNWLWNFFTDRLASKCAVIYSLKISRQLDIFPLYLVKHLCFRNHRVQPSEVNCHARQTVKRLLKILLCSCTTL